MYIAIHRNGRMLVFPLCDGCMLCIVVNPSLLQPSTHDTIVSSVSFLLLSFLSIACLSYSMNITLRI